MISAQAVLFDWATSSQTAGLHSSGNAAPTENLFVGQDEGARSRRLAVYARRHLEKSMRHLRRSFEASATALGPERYRHAVELFLCLDPATGPQQRWLGNRFAEFLNQKSIQEHLGTSQQPWLGDLAKLDWAQSLATNAPMEDELHFSDLRDTPPEQWPQVHVTWLACVQRLDSKYNLLDVRNKSLSTPPPSSGINRRPTQGTLAGVGMGPSANDSGPAVPRHWLVTRHDLDIVSLELSSLEAQLFDALRYPLSLTELSDLVASRCDLDEVSAARQAVGWVQQWSDWGCLKPALRTSLPPCS